MDPSQWGKLKVDPEPRDYFVPDFGVDADIKSTLAHGNAAETRLGVRFIGGKPPPDSPRDYFVPDFGVDLDIKANFQDLAATEKSM